jgi:hypothetical protein
MGLLGVGAIWQWTTCLGVTQKSYCLQLSNVHWSIQAIQTERMITMAKAGRRPVPVTIPNIHVAANRHIELPVNTIPIHLFHFVSDWTSSSVICFCFPFRASAAIELALPSIESTLTVESFVLVSQYPIDN